MAKIFRVIAAIVILIGVIGLAQNETAWAANSTEQTGPYPVKFTEKFSPPVDDDFCDKTRNKNKEKCKEKDKDKNPCKKNKEKCGSVKPPPPKIVIPVTGEYSVGGLCTLSVVFTDPNLELDARVKTPLPRKLPTGVENMRQGCLLTYFSGLQRINSLPPASGSTLICFAANPKKQMMLYFYDIYSSNPKWVPIETTVQGGRACGAGNRSGVYVATFGKH